MANELNIFYTDDDIDDIDIFTDVALEIDPKYIIHSYNSGKKLLNALDNPPPRPTMLFLDLNMPGLTDFDVLTKLRSTEAFKNLPIVGFSTSSDAMSIANSKKLGASFYVTKSSDFVVFKKSIAHVLNIDWNSFTATDDTFVYKP